MIAWLTNRYKRRAISAPNFAFYAWKFAANAVPTYHAMRMRRDGQRHQDTIAALREQGIVMADDGSVSDRRWSRRAGRRLIRDPRHSQQRSCAQDHRRQRNE